LDEQLKPSHKICVFHNLDHETYSNFGKYYSVTKWTGLRAIYLSASRVWSIGNFKRYLKGKGGQVNWYNKVKGE
jgi:hypothetical protein